MWVKRQSEKHEDSSELSSATEISGRNKHLRSISRYLLGSIQKVKRSNSDQRLKIKKIDEEAQGFSPDITQKKNYESLKEGGSGFARIEDFHWPNE